jgi:hypothetical protein
MLAWLFACPNGLAWHKFLLQVKEVYLGKQFFSKETGWHMTQCYAQL